MLHLLVNLLLPLSLLPCSCDTVSLNKAIQFSDEIFTGNIIRIEKDVERGWRFLFEINKKWKGSDSKYIFLEQEGTSCDFTFSIREEYLVYATYSEPTNGFWQYVRTKINPRPTVITWLCSRTTSRYHHLNEYNWYADDHVHLDKVFPDGVQIQSLRARMDRWLYPCLSLIFLVWGFFACRKFLSKNV